MTVTSAQAAASAAAALAAIEPSWVLWHVVQADGGPYLVGLNGVTISKAYIIVAPNLSFGYPNGGGYYDRSLSGYDMIFSYDECSLPYVLDATGNFCVLPPQDYVCTLPRQWVQTIEGDWKCVQVSQIPTDSGSNQYGISGTEGNYHTEAFPGNLHCDPSNDYICIPTGFWRDLIASTQTETL